jgi:hypothetical protein
VDYLLEDYVEFIKGIKTSKRLDDIRNEGIYLKFGEIKLEVTLLLPLENCCVFL